MTTFTVFWPSVGLGFALGVLFSIAVLISIAAYVTARGGRNARNRQLPK